MWEVQKVSLGSDGRGGSGQLTCLKSSAHVQSNRVRYVVAEGREVEKRERFEQKISPKLVVQQLSLPLPLICQ